MFIGHWSKYNISVLFGPFLPHQDSNDTRIKEGGRGEKPSNHYVIPVTSRGCFGVGLCWDIGMLQAMIDIISEHNVSTNNKNLLFSAVLSWFHLAVTLGWSHHDLGVTPLWNQTPTDVIMCMVGGHSRTMVKPLIRDMVGGPSRTRVKPLIRDIVDGPSKTRLKPLRTRVWILLKIP